MLDVITDHQRCCWFNVEVKRKTNKTQDTCGSGVPAIITFYIDNSRCFEKSKQAINNYKWSAFYSSQKHSVQTNSKRLYLHHYSNFVLLVSVQVTDSLQNIVTIKPGSHARCFCERREGDVKTPVWSPWCTCWCN